MNKRVESLISFSFNLFNSHYISSNPLALNRIVIYGGRVNIMEIGGHHTYLLKNTLHNLELGMMSPDFRRLKNWRKSNRLIT